MEKDQNEIRLKWNQTKTEYLGLKWNETKTEKSKNRIRIKWNYIQKEGDQIRIGLK